MNRIIYYFVLPSVALVLFGGYYFGVYHKEIVAAREAEEARIAAEKEKKEAEKKAAEEIAIAEAARRTQEKRDAEDAKRKADEDRQREEDDKLAAAVKEAEERVATKTKEHADLEIDLLETRRMREAEEKQAFALSRQVELAKIDRRNAELEIQLNTEKMATRVEASSMVQDLFPPPMPATTDQPQRR